MATTRTHSPHTQTEASGPRTTVLEAPVVSVTVMEDRAQVRRVGKARLSAGRMRLTVDDVATVIVDKTLLVSGKARGGLKARVDDVRVRRSIDHLQDDHNEQEQSLRDELGKSLEELSIATQEKTGAHHWLEGLLALQAQFFKDIRQDAAWGRDQTTQWAEQQKQLIEKLADANDRHTLATHQLSKVQQHVDDLRARLESLGQKEGGVRRAQIEIDLNIDQGGTYEITVDYVVPNACWRPYHTARLRHRPDGAQLDFQTEACVWQNTGEDWTDVKMTFSTLRPSLGQHPPELHSEPLTSQKRQELVVETREEKIHTSGLGAESVAAKGLPGVEDRGQTFHLEADGTYGLPSDGRPNRIRLFDFVCEAQTELVCKPELARTILLASTQTNPARHPLLAGPVDLVRECGFTGRTTLGYIAPGETFELGWGPQDAFRAHRSHRKIQKDVKLIGHWDATEHHITVTLSNLGPESATVHLTERIPVSEVEQVQVHIDHKKTTDGKTMDKNGMASWSLILPPHDHEKIELCYTVRRASGTQGA